MPSTEVIASSLVSGCLLGGMLALTAVGLSLVLGGVRLVNLAHGEFLIGGAYLGLFAQELGLDPLLALVPVGVVMALLAAPLERLLIAPLAGQGLEAPMMTMFGLSIVLQNVFVLAFRADTRAIEAPYAVRSISVGPVSVAQIYPIGFLISVALVCGLHVLLTRSRFGRELRASASDPVAAAALGIDVRRVHASTFALGAASAGMGGVLIGTTFSFAPSSGNAHLLWSFAVVVLGGVGNIQGTLLAGIVLGVLSSLGAIVLGDGYRDLVGLGLFLVVLALRPSGLVTAGVR